MQIANREPVESEVILQNGGGNWYTSKPKYAKRQVGMADESSKGRVLRDFLLLESSWAPEETSSVDPQLLQGHYTFLNAKRCASATYCGYALGGITFVRRHADVTVRSDTV